MRLGPRQGDPVPVVVNAADGPVVVWHTPDQLAVLNGPEPELAAADSRYPLARDECECEALCDCDRPR